MIFAGAVVGIAAVVAAGCSRRSCLRGDCEQLRACDELAFACEGGTLWIGRLADAPAELRLAGGEGAGDDVLMSNGVVTLVIDAVDTPHDLAPTGGNLIDLGPAGGVDDVNLIAQVAGILPDDSFAYTAIATIDEADHVAIDVRGHLDGRADVDVWTRYELRPCDPGVRVRSELFNGSPDTHAWVLADVPHWGKRRIAPFAPAPGQGYVQPELDLLELDSLYQAFDYGAGAAAAPGSPGYAVAACNESRLEGVNDLELSALGTARRVVRPGQSIVLERFWATAGAGQGPAPAIAEALAVREQALGDPSPFGIGGRVVAGGLGFGGDARRASLLVSARVGDVETPLTSVVPDEDGRFVASVREQAGLVWALSSFGRVVASGEVPANGAIGDIAIELPGTLQVAVSEGPVGMYASVVLVPADDATEQATRGTFHGQFLECAPWLGPPNGGSPACNRFLVDPGGGEAEVPAGTYDVYATAGPDYTLARQRGVTIVAGEIATVELALTRLDVVPAGWLRADLHVHGRASFDSALPDDDRVRSFVAAGIEVVAATDHDEIVDYADTVAALAVGDRVHVIGGLETTQLVPWMEVPGTSVPRVIGHFNFFPLVPDPTAPRGGAPWDEKMEPGQLFDVMQPRIGAGGVRMLNHPWAEASAGRDLGYLRAIELDPRRTIPARDDGSHNGMLVRAPAGGLRNLDWNLVEVQNGAGVKELVKTRPLWWSLLSQGFVAAGTANSDSHGLNDAQLGWPRTLVETGGDLAGFELDAFTGALRDGHTVGGSGIWIDVAIVRGGARLRGLGLAPYVPASDDRVAIEVRAAPWIPVDEIRVVTSGGERVIASGADLAHPADPFGAGGVVRFSGDVTLAELVGGGDDWFVIEAGLPLPEYRDLDDDGVPDTGDNDGDGDVDTDDVEAGEDRGPLEDPPDPARDAESDPRYPMTRVVPHAFPVAFTSPILVDADGGGWDPPGLSP